MCPEHPHISACELCGSISVMWISMNVVDIPIWVMPGHFSLRVVRALWSALMHVCM